MKREGTASEERVEGIERNVFLYKGVYIYLEILYIYIYYIVSFALRDV